MQILYYCFSVDDDGNPIDTEPPIVDDEDDDDDLDLDLELDLDEEDEDEN